MTTRGDVALLLLRLSGFGLAYAHGWGKLSRLVAGELGFVEGVARLGFPAPGFFAWAAALAETLFAVLLGLGLLTRLSAGIVAFNMLVAAFRRHQAHRQLLAALGLETVTDKTLEAWGNPELALMYLLAVVVVLILGPGRLSLDHALGRRGKS